MLPPNDSCGVREELVEALVDVGDVARDVRFDSRVDQGRHRALVLAVLPENLRADRHHGLRVLAAEDVAHGQLVAVVRVGVQEADGDRRDPAVAEPSGHLDGPGLVEGPDLVPLEVEPAADRLDEVGGHDAGASPRRYELPYPSGTRLRNLEDELVALGGDEAESLDLALEQLVGRDRRSVRDGGDVLPVASIRSRTLRTPLMKPSAGLLGVDGVLVVTSSPVSSSSATTSVNVPPVSMPILIRRAVMEEFNSRDEAMPWHKLPMEGANRTRHRQSIDSSAENEAGRGARGG